jgi:hypothetical protein
MIEHPLADKQQVCHMFDLSHTTLISHRYKWRKREQIQPAPAFDPPPPAPSPEPVKYREPEYIHPPSEHATAYDRARYRLAKRFHELAALWGDWIKK